MNMEIVTPEEGKRARVWLERTAGGIGLFFNGKCIAEIKENGYFHSKGLGFNVDKLLGEMPDIREGMNNGKTNRQ